MQNDILKIQNQRKKMGKSAITHLMRQKREKEDYYNVVWTCKPLYTDKKIMKETDPDQIVSSDGKRYYVTDFVKNIGIFFDNVDKAVKISVYNDECAFWIDGKIQNE